MKRRDFLKAAGAASLGLSGCGMKDENAKLVNIPKVSEAQAALKKEGISKVALIKAASYDEDLVPLIESYAAKVDLPDLSNKRVVIKPNMVEFKPNRPITTNPRVLSAAIEVVKNMGAKEVVIAEGPGHMRDTEFLLDATGLGAAIKEAGCRFVDLNLDDLVKVPNVSGFNGLKHFYMPRTIIDADAVISLPKLKMHHWVGVTCSMKNLFGTVPGRKYGWPKNLLHIKGIRDSIIDLVHIVKPVFTLVDAIVAMEGDGPINGTALETGFLALGTDLAAVDATCVRITSVDPHELSYIVLAGLVVGNIDEEKIEIIGESVESLKKPFAQPITIKSKELLARAAHAGS